MKIACLLDIGFIHHLDHLIPFADTFGCTVCVFSEEDYEDAHRWYPDPPVIRIPQSELSLLSIFDLLVVSSNETGPFLKSHLGTSCPPLFFLPHGQSDKGYIKQLNGIYSSRFVYGTFMEKQLHAQNVSCKSVLHVGNFRKVYFEKHQAFFRVKKGKKPTVLFAPTWHDPETRSKPFFSRDILNELSTDYDILVKLHPFTERDFPGEYYSFTGSFSVVESPWVYPYLHVCDYYLGDYSSVGYDALASGLPLTFIADLKEDERGSFLHQFGRRYEKGVLESSCALKAAPFLREVFSAVPKKEAFIQLVAAAVEEQQRFSKA